MNQKNIFEATQFVLIFIVISFFINLIYKNFIMASSVLTRVDQQFHASPSEIKYLILGDSHGQDDVDPQILGDSFNFSSAGGSYIHSYYKLKYILDGHLKKIDTIILPLDMHSFASANLKPPLDSWYWIKYVDYLQLAQYSPNKIFYLYEFCRGIFFAYISQRDSFLHFVKADHAPRSIAGGFIPCDDVLSDDGTSTEAAEKRAGYHFKDGQLLDGVLMLYFDKIIDLCKKNNIKVVLVRFPVYKQYYQEVAKLVSNKNIEDIPQRVTRKYPDVIFKDFIDLYFEKKSYFRDIDHLNTSGAKDFSKYLKDQLTAREF